MNLFYSQKNIRNMIALYHEINLEKEKLERIQEELTLEKSKVQSLLDLKSGIRDNTNILHDVYDTFQRESSKIVKIQNELREVKHTSERAHIQLGFERERVNTLQNELQVEKEKLDSLRSVVQTEKERADTNEVELRSEQVKTANLQDRMEVMEKAYHAMLARVITLES